jgi:hypothetical protein
MARYGYHFANTADSLILAPQATWNGVQNFGLCGKIKLDVGCAPGPFNALISKWSNTAADQAFMLAWSSAANVFGIPGAPGSNFLVLRLTQGAFQYQTWVTTFDPFAGWPGDGLWHSIMPEWHKINLSGHGTGRSLLSIDGATLTTGQWVQVDSSDYGGGGIAPSSTAPIVLGGVSGALAALPGLSISDVGFLHNPNMFLAGETLFSYPTDPTNYHAGYPAEVIQNGVVDGALSKLDVLAFNNTSPELGFNGYFTGTVSGATAVAGPTLFQTFAATVSLNHGGTCHSPGSIRVTVSGGADWAPSSPVTFTLAPSIGTPSGTITLGTSANASGSALISVPGSVSPTTATLAITNNGGVAPLSTSFNVILPTTRIATADPLGGLPYGTMPSGRLMYVWLSDLAGNPAPVTSVDLTGSSVTNVTTSKTLSLTGRQAGYNGRDNYFWFNAGEPPAIAIIDDLDGGCAKTATTPAFAQASPHTELYQNYGTGVSYSADPAASVVYGPFAVTPGAPYLPARNAPDVYQGGPAAIVPFTATTHADYAVSDGTSTWHFAVDQTAVGLDSVGDLLYRWTVLGHASATATVSGGVVTGLTIVDGGAHYTSAPKVWIQGGCGTGATAHAVLTGGVISSLVVDTPGSGYVLNPYIATDTPPLVWIEPPTITPAGSSLTITVTNAAGAGTLYTDAIRVESIPLPFQNPGDDVRLSLLDAAAETTLGTSQAYDGTANAPLQLTLATDDGGGDNRLAWFPWDPSAPRRLNPGANLAGATADNVSSLFANWTKRVPGWSSGGVTTDGNGQMAGITPNATSGLGNLANPLGQENNGVDFWNFPIVPLSGPWTISFNTPGNPTVTLAQGTNTIGVSIPPGTNYGPGGFASGPGTGIVMQQTPGYGPYPKYHRPLLLSCKSNGSALDYITNLWIKDPLTPAAWAHLAHPSFYYRFHGRFSNSYVRTNNITGAGPNVRNLTDYLSRDSLCYDHESTFQNPLVSFVYPLTQSGYATANTMAGALGRWGGNTAWVIVVTATPHLMGDGCTTNMVGVAGGYTDSVGGTLSFPDNAKCFVVDDHTLLLKCYTTTANSSGTLITIGTPITGSGEQITMGAGGYQPPPGDFIALCNEVITNLLSNLPLTATEQFWIDYGIYCAANLNSGRKIALELTNEPWNYLAGAYEPIFLMNRWQQYLYTSTSGRLGVNLPNSDAWYAYNAGRRQALFLSAWTGIPAVQIDGYGSGATAVATVVAGAVTAINLTGPVTSLVLGSGGSGYSVAPTVTLSPPNDPTGKQATATCTISGGVVNALSLVSGGLGYTAPPTVSFSSGAASATALITTGGTGYTTAPAITIAGGNPGSGTIVPATAAAVISGGKVTGFTGLSGGSGYTLTGRNPADVKRVFSTFGGGVGTTINTAAACAQWGITMDAVMATTYLDNSPNGHTYNSGAPGAMTIDQVNGLYDTCSFPNDGMDLYGFHTLRVSFAPFSSDHIAALPGAGVTYPVELWAYEGGGAKLCPYGFNAQRSITRAALLPRDPRWGRAVLANIQQQDLLYGYTQVCREGFDSFISPTVGIGSEWYEFLVQGADVGSGKKGENANPWELTNLLSQEGWALRLYAQAPTAAPTSTAGEAFAKLLMHA